MARSYVAKRSIEAIGQPENLGLHGMGMGVVGRGRNGLRGRFVGTGQHLGRVGIPTVAVDENEGLGEPDSGLTVGGIDSKSILEQRDGSLHVVLVRRPSIQDEPATHGEVHRIRVGALRPASLDIDELDTEHPCKAVRDAEVVLEGRQRALIHVHLSRPTDARRCPRR